MSPRTAAFNSCHLERPISIIVISNGRQAEEILFKISHRKFLKLSDQGDSE
ncbi:hypothetical protein ACFLZQ_03010 [Thermodesulfobacteriota bacterium]